MMHRAIAVAVFLFLGAGIAAAQISVVGSLTHIHRSEAGATHGGTVLVRNDADGPRAVRVFRTDYQFDAAGRVAYERPGSHDRSNAPWVSLPATTVSIPAGTTLPLSYAVRVPERPDLAGTYWSVIMIESDLEQSAAGSDRSLGVRHVMRFAVQVITEFPGGDGELVTIGAELSPEDDGPVLTLDVANAGTRMVRPGVSVELYARDGSVLGPFEALPRRLFPGSSTRFSVALQGARAGEFRALVILDGGGEDVSAAQYTLEID